MLSRRERGRLIFCVCLLALTAVVVSGLWFMAPIGSSALWMIPVLFTGLAGVIIIAEMRAVVAKQRIRDLEAIREKKIAEYVCCPECNRANEEITPILEDGRRLDEEVDQLIMHRYS